jgi:acyl-CoA dehydrogenase
VTPLRFDLAATDPALAGLREAVREFIARETPAGSHFTQDDPAFSRKVGARGWIGMTWPARWGGRERAQAERYVVVEEMLAAGAPIFHHWVADRQSGPLILRFGTDEQRARFLPAITRGECCFAIGLSEPDAGSDLSGVAAKAVRDDAGGWRLSGTKVWTSNAHNADFMIVLCRTSPRSAERHEGLGQFIVDMRLPGVQVNPIRNIAGEHEFNEVVFDGVQLPDALRLGPPGAGWEQMMGELAFERSGPDRFLSAMHLLRAFVDAAGTSPTDEEAAFIGRAVARLATLRRMSLSVAGMLAQRAPNVEAAVVKDLGTQFEQETVAACRSLRPAWVTGESASGYERACADALLYMPRVTLQGGTTQVLRNAIARGLGLR